MLSYLLKYIFSSALIIFTLLFLSLNTFAQGSSPTISSVSAKWRDGTILLNDGTQLEGILWYNDQTGVLSFEKGSETRSFVSRNIASFKFYDPHIGKDRYFYSFPYENPENNAERMLFFELMKDMKDFVVLSKVDPIEMEQIGTSVPGSMDPVTGIFTSGFPTASVTRITQTETIYIMNEEGVIQPYIKVVEKAFDNDKRGKSKKKNKMVDEDLLSKYTAGHYEKLREYARQNKLRFNRKSDLMQILEYYESLREF